MEIIFLTVYWQAKPRVSCFVLTFILQVICFNAHYTFFIVELYIRTVLYLGGRLEESQPEDSRRRPAGRAEWAQLHLRHLAHLHPPGRQPRPFSLHPRLWLPVFLFHPSLSRSAVQPSWLLGGTCLFPEEPRDWIRVCVCGQLSSVQRGRGFKLSVEQFPTSELQECIMSEQKSWFYYFCCLNAGLF